MSIDPAGFAAAVGIVGVAVGAVLNAVLSDWAARRRELRAERRSARAEQAARQLGALRQTRRRARDVVRQLKVLAVKPVAWDRSDPFEGANDALIGDVEVIRAYREVLIDLQTRFGRGLPIDSSRRAARVLGEIDRSIAAQEDRVRDGKSPIVICIDLADDLFDLDAFSRRLLTVNQPPAMEGVFARAVIDMVRLGGGIWSRFGTVRRRKSSAAMLPDRAGPPAVP